MLQQVLGMGVTLPLPRFLLSPLQASALPVSTASPVMPTLSQEDDQFLEELERAIFLFFWEQSSEKTGMVKDRCNVHKDGQGLVASIAANGLGLTALCIRDHRGFVGRADPLHRAFTALRFLWQKPPQHRGSFFHLA